MFKIGQREVSAFVFIGIALLSIAVGVPRENILEYFLTIVGPLAGLLATFKFFTDTITSNVQQGKYQPGEIVPMLTSREFLYALATAIVSGLMMAGVVTGEADKQMLIDTIGNGLLFIGASLQRSFSVRPPGSAVPAPPAPPSASVEVTGAQKVEAQNVQVLKST